MTSLADQLDTWSNQGATTSAKRTYASIRTALSKYSAWPDDVDYEVYLQGSYKNNTNIYADSDVDIIVQLNSTYHGNPGRLSPSAKRVWDRSSGNVSYGWSSFREDVLTALQIYYDVPAASSGNKSIKVSGDGSSRLDADVVPCLQHRLFGETLSDWIEGIVFWTRSARRRIVNFPKQHYRNGVDKHQATGRQYKPTVRIFKNLRTRLVEEGQISTDLAPSYFVECLLFNAPDACFQHSKVKTLGDVFGWFLEADLGELVCQNGRRFLFGTGGQRWSKEGAVTYMVESAKWFTDQL